MLGRSLLLCGIAIAIGAPAGALVVQGEDTELSRTAPPRMRVWRYVGSRGAVTAIYVGNGWVLTAHHVPPGDVVFDGVSYAAVPESRIRLADPGGGSVQPDLAVFRIHPSPDFEPLEIRRSPPEVGEPVVMIGCGRERGAELTWNGIAGYALTSSRTKRWGSNRIEEVGHDYSTQYTNTRVFSTSFDPFDTRYEAQAVNGDSGGGVFTKHGDKWLLAGVIFTVLNFTDQPEDSSVYGNRSFAVDLSHYSDQLLELIGADAATHRKNSDPRPSEGTTAESDLGR